MSHTDNLVWIADFRRRLKEVTREQLPALVREATEKGYNAAHVVAFWEMDHRDQA